MEYKFNKENISKFISNICNGRAEEELKIAEDNFAEYLSVVKSICTRLIKEGKTNLSFDENIKEK